MQRERLTITLEPDLIAAADSLVDKSAIRNRSHAIEHLMKEGLGLHQLHQAVFFMGDGWTQQQAERLTTLCQNQGITEVFLCGPAADMRLLLSGFTIREVPLDFGSGGSLLLKKEALRHPFLLAWLDKNLALPESLVGAYATHRSRQATVTQLLASGTAASYHFAGLAVASPSLLDSIPAGIVSLEETVFPELLKKGNVGTYAFPA